MITKRIIKIIKKIIKGLGFDIIKYKQPNYKWLQMQEIKTVIDVGANIGQFATFISKILPVAKIYSFEPIKECYDALVN